MIPECPLNKMVPLTEDHGGGGDARGPPLAHGLVYSTFDERDFHTQNFSLSDTQFH